MSEWTNVVGISESFIFRPEADSFFLFSSGNLHLVVPALHLFAWTTCPGTGRSQQSRMVLPNINRLLALYRYNWYMHIYTHVPNIYIYIEKYRFVLLFIFVQNAPLNCINRSLKRARAAESMSASNINLIRESKDIF